MDMSWKDFEQSFIDRKTGSNIVLHVVMKTIPTFCVGVKFNLEAGGVTPQIRFFCSNDGESILTQKASDITQLNSVNVIPNELYLPAGLIYNRIKTWMSGAVSLNAVMLNSTEYATSISYKDHL